MMGGMNPGLGGAPGKIMGCTAILCAAIICICIMYMAGLTFGGNPMDIGGIIIIGPLPAEGMKGMPNGPIPMGGAG